MARSSRRNRIAAAFALAALLASAPVSAHRRDEYLQAARVAIDPERVRIDLDLTPGIAVADRILADIDLDKSGTLSSSETEAYVRRVLDAITVDVDGSPLAVQRIESAFPAIDAVRQGEGTIRIQLSAAVPHLAPGEHRLRYTNAYRPDVGAYLANALVPRSDRVAVTGQDRDRDQREFRVDYHLSAATPPLHSRGTPLIAIGALLALAVLSGVRAMRGASTPALP
jgi:hypothetical protein